MTESFPLAEIADGIMTVRFRESDATKVINITCVVDYTDFGDVVGIEILDWRHQLAGGQIDAPPASGQLRWSYDAEIDALYIHTTDARGQNQRRMTATAKLDAKQRVVIVKVPLPSPVART
jgi:uncharacterized protein YuzE